MRWTGNPSASFGCSGFTASSHDALDIRELEAKEGDRCETEEDGGVFD
jgi:hypothetical protein